jgi:hypothetical protein
MPTKAPTAIALAVKRLRTDFAVRQISPARTFLELNLSVWVTFWWVAERFLRRERMRSDEANLPLGNTKYKMKLGLSGDFLN